MLVQQLLTSKIYAKEKFDLIPQVIQKNIDLFAVYFVFLITYACFSLIPKPPALTLERYHLSVLGVRLIYLTIIIILALIWGAGFYGFAKLRAYSRTIGKQKDGKPVRIITNGIFLIVMWLPVSEVISVILRFIGTHHAGFMPAATIIDNYIYLLLPLAGFILLGVGARGLSGLIKAKHNFFLTNFLYLVVVFAGVTYAHLVATTKDIGLVYNLSIWVILLTIVVPYMYMWVTGATAAYEIYNYQRLVSGVLYKRSWSMLAIGCGWLIIGSMFFQYVATVLGSRLNTLSIYAVLAIIYSLLAVLSIGFIFIALGAARLQKIEEV
ncbi:MAG TPA: hypothetical protein VFN31_01330 [Candidatus Saccharimonadales bacterium]|nr:hypothetical protein [Candidatus Saccharimonadales bacterium]